MVVGCAVGLGNSVDVGDRITAVSVEVGSMIGVTVAVWVGIDVEIASAG